MKKAGERKGLGAKVPGSELARVLLAYSLRGAIGPGAKRLGTYNCPMSVHASQAFSTPSVPINVITPMFLQFYNFVHLWKGKMLTRYFPYHVFGSVWKLQITTNCCRSSIERWNITLK